MHLSLPNCRIFSLLPKEALSHPLFGAKVLPQAAEASSGDLVVLGASVHGHPKRLVLALRKRVVGTR